MATIDFEHDAALTAPSNEQLKTISALAARQMKLERELAEINQKAKDVQKQLRQVSEIDLPEAMGEAGIEAFTTSDGANIAVRETLYASFPKAAAKKREAIQWLIDNDLATIVKEDVHVPFDKGEVEKVGRLVELLEQSGFDEYRVVETVNTGTIKAVIKELLQEGKDVPLQLLGAYFVRKAEVKQ